MKNSSLFSSARPIVFLQNENCEGPFWGRFLVKKLDIFSPHAPGKAYRFFALVPIEWSMEISLRV